MKSILIVLMLVFSLGTFAKTENASSKSSSITFEKGNFFPITQQFDGRLLDNFTEKVLNYKGKELYVYFDTPGGSVIALAAMARLMKASNVKFTCIAKFAASAGFMLFQHCQKRLIFSDGILMSHNWAGGFYGEAPRILTLFNTVQSLVDTLEAVAIKKMNVDKKEYAALINSNLWMSSTLAKSYKAVDAVQDNVKCSKLLLKQRIPVTFRISPFSNETRTFYKSGCPLIQKIYTRASNSNGEIYVNSDKTLFELSQKGYKLEEANWIYLGKK